VPILPRSRKRRIVTALVVVAAAALFTWEWTAAPRVKIDPQVERRLQEVHGHPLYLGRSFEGLPLRSVTPFRYSDCKPGLPVRKACDTLVVAGGHVSGTDPEQVSRAAKHLRRVGAGTR
jgi:hypothetical protein